MTTVIHISESWMTIYDRKDGRNIAHASNLDWSCISKGDDGSTRVAMYAENEKDEISCFSINILDEVEVVVPCTESSGEKIEIIDKFGTIMVNWLTDEVSTRIDTDDDHRYDVEYRLFK